METETSQENQIDPSLKDLFKQEILDLIKDPTVSGLKVYLSVYNGDDEDLPPQAEIFKDLFDMDSPEGSFITSDVILNKHIINYVRYSEGGGFGDNYLIHFIDTESETDFWIYIDPSEYMLRYSKSWNSLEEDIKFCSEFYESDLSEDPESKEILKTLVTSIKDALKTKDEFEDSISI